LKIEKDAARPVARDAAFGQCVDDVVETGEDVAEGAHGRETRAEDVGLANSGIDALLPLVVALVVIAELLAEESGGSAGTAVRLGEIANAVRQGKPPKRLATVQPAAKNRSGRRESGGKMRHACAQRISVAGK
jgi:hypothetical protein